MASCRFQELEPAAQKDRASLAAWLLLEVNRSGLLMTISSIDQRLGIHAKRPSLSFSAAPQRMTLRVCCMLPLTTRQQHILATPTNSTILMQFEGFILQILRCVSTLPLGAQPSTIQGVWCTFVIFIFSTSSNHSGPTTAVDVSNEAWTALIDLHVEASIRLSACQQTPSCCVPALSRGLGTSLAWPVLLVIMCLSVG